MRSLLAIAMLAAWLLLPAATRAQTPAQAEPPGEPEIGARAAIVVEYPSGRILFERAMHDRLAPASTTKILTAILALEHGNVEDTVTVSPDDLVGESSMGLESGEQQTLHNLLYGMMLPSGNDAAMAVARYLGSQGGAPGSGDPIARFSEMMNARVSQLGLTDSHFVNPHGLDAEGHYSSAYDLASLAWYAFQFPTFNEVIKTRFYDAPGHSLKNTNEMLSRYEGADGVKTGWTDEGGLCLVTSATRNGQRLISVVLNAPHWYTDSGAILDYGFAKLAAQPDAPGMDVLSVAARGTGNWLLADATQTPPIAASQELAQGGGVVAGSVAAPATSNPPPAPVDQDKFVTRATVAIAGTSGGGGSLPLGVMFLAAALAMVVAASGWWVISSRVPRFEPRPLAGLNPFAVRAANAPAQVAPSPRPAPHTLGDAPVVRRREPNLMLTPEQACQAHIRLAIALAEQGRQGSSMAEFLLALRSGCEMKVAEIDATYGLTSNGYLALYRAQAAVGRMDDAYDTLQYGAAAVPGDRMIALTLRQLTNRSA
jgi:D-alanyl-D-alanine carboxypeptidase